MSVTRERGGMAKIARTISEILVDIGALHVDLDNPFVFTSGTQSPAYVDCRKVISFVSQRRTIIELARSMIMDEIGLKNIDLIAGGETAGIPYAAWVSESLNLPMIYVRKKPKDFGRLKQIEGDLNAGQKVLLVEDLIFDAGSKLDFHSGIVHAGALMEHILVVFDYGNRKARRALEQRGLQLHAMANWDALLEVASKRSAITQREHEAILAFLEDPENWGKSRLSV